MVVAPPADCERRRMSVDGVVQGVGFRPFVFGLARRHGLGGFVLNTGAGVTIEAEGAGDQLDAFSAALIAQAPPLARVASVTAVALTPCGEREFTIAASRGAGTGGPHAPIPADAATCEDCVRELFDRIAERRDAGPAVGDRLAHRPLEDRDEQVVLAAEIEVDSAGGDAGGARHVGDLRVEEAALGEDVGRGAKDGLALVGPGLIGLAERGDVGH